MQRALRLPIGRRSSPDAMRWIARRLSIARVFSCLAEDSSAYATAVECIPGVRTQQPTKDGHQLADLSGRDKLIGLTYAYCERLGNQIRVLVAVVSIVD